jgi:argininosuccinate lyase
VGSLHNTPFTDINDSEDDLQPLVYTTFDDADRSLDLLCGVLEEIEFLTDRMRACANANFLTVTELADTLVREAGISFHQAHTVVSAAVKEQHGNFDAEQMATSVRRVLAETLPGAALPSQTVLSRSLDAANFVSVRTIPGGPAPSALEPEIERARDLAAADRSWLSTQTEEFAKGRERAKADTEKLLASISSTL